MTRFSTVLAILILTCAGCQTPPSAGTTLAQASARYASGDLDEARQLARTLISGADQQSDEAAWIVGLCDYRQGKLTQARQRFRYVTTGSDQVLAAQARVMLAQLDLTEGRSSAALANLARAWPHLTERDHRRTAECGVAAAIAENDVSAKDLWLSRMPAAPSRTTPELAAVHQRFTLQSGAFRNLAGAHDARAILADQIHDDTLGRPQIRTRTDRRGQPLYLVQIGSFATRAAANQARSSVPVAELMIVSQ